MKELSIEEKAKRYDEALERARIYYSTTDSVADAELIELIFPELKESEDEKIRKELVSFVESRLAGFPKCDRFIAWIEKQGEKPQGKSALEAIKEENVNNADKVEPKFKVGDWVVYYRNDSSREVLQVYDIRDGRYYFTDNVHFSWSVKECDEKSHLWTIQDAKEGDVIFYDKGWTCIFKHIHGIWYSSYCFITNEGEFHTGYEEHDVDAKINGNVHPATEEQRNLLLEKMREAGYEWDREKKELRKIDWNPQPGDTFRKKGTKSPIYHLCDKLEDGIHFVFVEERENGIAGGEISIFALKNEYELVERLKPVEKVIEEEFNKITELKPSWCEEDDQYLLVCKNALAKYQASDKWNATIISQWLDNKLKTLRLLIDLFIKRLNLQNYAIKINL